MNGTEMNFDLATSVCQGSELAGVEMSRRYLP